MKLCSRLLFLSKRRQIQVLYPHFEEVRGGIEPSLMARWKARVEFLLSVIELLFYLLRLRRYKGKHAIRRGQVCWSQDFRGKGSSLENIFWFLQNQTHFAIRQCKLRVLCAVVLTQYRRVTDGQTDGIAIASTALAMRALRRAVIKGEFTDFHLDDDAFRCFNRTPACEPERWIMGLIRCIYTLNHKKT